MSTKHQTMILQALESGPANSAELGRLLGVHSKTAWTALHSLADEGYVVQLADKSWALQHRAVEAAQRQGDLPQPEPEQPLTKSERAELRELRELFSVYDGAMHCRPVVSDWLLRPQGRSDHHATVAAQLTDTHFDEVIQPSEVLHLNAYNPEIAEQRLKLWVEKVVTLPREYMAGMQFDGLWVPATGDIFSGDIHEELQRTNARDLYESVAVWTAKIVSALLTLEREYPAVQVDAVVGNHGRNSKKPIFKGRAKNNIEWLFWHHVRELLAAHGSRVVVNVSDAMDMSVSVYERNHLLTHGDSMKGGTGISGAYAPLSLGQHRTSVRQIAAGEPMTTMVMGHFHQVLDLPGLIVGGSMKGYDEYAFGLRLRPEPAAQMLWTITPERGKTMSMPIVLQDRDAEGW